MRRQILKNLKKWKDNPRRKPLILKGARQVGKTYILKFFGQTEYANVLYLNFETKPSLKSLFAEDLDPEKIINVLSIEYSLEIIPQKTLIIFDEVQECPAALNSLKYFNELANQFHICAAGSLLGVTLANTKGFPVGNVDFLELFPLSFSEYLLALGEEKLIQYIDDVQDLKPFPNLIHEKLLNYFKEYLFVGGMPEAILEYVNTKDFNKVREIHHSILEAYRLDFAKHAPANLVMKITQVWEVIPSQLAKENKKFIYSVIRKGARAAEFEVALQWLKEAGLIYKVYHASTPKIPLSAYVNHDIFKIYLVDVGLLGAMADLPAKTIIHGDEIFQEFKGALAENYVAQGLALQHYALYYWTSEGQAELDFIIQEENQIYPLEVKSGIAGKKKSLMVYSEKYHPKLKIKISPLNLVLNESTLNCPFYLFYQLKKILKVR